MGAKTLKAFVVQEEDEGSGGVIFAKTNAQARRLGANEYAAGEWDYVTCRRAPWADQFVETQHVPVMAYLMRGWHWECRGCERRIELDGYAFADDEPDWSIDDVVEHQPGHPFHSQACYEVDRDHHAERIRRQNRAIAAFQSLVLKRFPKAEFSQTPEGSLDRHHAHASKNGQGRWRVSQIAVSFDFPGQTIAPAQLRYDEGMGGQKRQKPYFSCCNGDRQAFEVWAAGTLDERSAA